MNPIKARTNIPSEYIELEQIIQTVIITFNDGSQMIVEDVERNYLGPEGVALCLTKQGGEQVIINFDNIKYYTI